MLIVGFDLDQTLVGDWGTTPIPGVVDRLAELRARPDIKTFVATNQAGPLWRTLTGNEKYPDAQNVATRLHRCAWELSLVEGVPWFVSTYDPRLEDILIPPSVERYARVCAEDIQNTMRGMNVWWVLASHDPEWRKPNSGMLRAGYRAFDGTTGDTCVYIGDSLTDRQAAEAAGVQFIDATEWRAGRALF